jgi:hypothetical protein
MNRINSRILGNVKVFCVVIVALLSGLHSLDLFAEGSRDLYPSGASGYRSYLMSRGVGNSDNFDPFSNSGVIRVYAKAGEVIYAGSSIVGKRFNSNATKGNIIITSPTGVRYTLTSSQVDATYNTRAGLIENRTEELNGPNRPGVTNGYTPFTVTVPSEQDGIWEVQFTSPKNGTTTPNSNLPSGSQHNAITFDGYNYTTSFNANFTANASWVQPIAYSSSEVGLIAAWDVSITSSASSGNLIAGRAYSTVSNLTGPNSVFSQLSFYGKFIVLTPSGYSYTVYSNGMNGASYNFFSNNKGVVSTASNFSSEASYKSLNTSTYSTLSTQIWDPRKPDDYVTNNFTNKLFYNKPASDLPATANTYVTFTTNGSATGTAYGVVSTWLKTPISAPTVSDLSISCSGLIRFTSNVKGTFRILIDCNNDGDYIDDVDKVIVSQAVVGENAYQWDQTNGSNAKLSPNSNVSIKVYITTAEIHFPYIDVEANKNGIKVFQNDENHNPIETADLVFWDDSPTTLNASSTQTASSPRASIHEGSHSNVSATMGEHAWGSRTTATDAKDTEYWGNNRTIDTWAFVYTNVAGSITTCVGITGRVLNDTDGNSNINGSGGTLLPTSLYATLVNSSNVAVQSVPVVNGYYDFNNVGNDTYSVVLSTSLNNRTASLPAGWTNVGEVCCNNGGNDGTVNGIVSVKVNGTSVSNNNFGIKSSGTVSIRGTVYNDNNGLTNNAVDGTGTNGGSGSKLTAYLVNEQGEVVGSSTVASNGTYTINGAYPSVPYKVIISNTAGVEIGNPAPAPSLPNGYQNVGEAFGSNNNAGSGTEKTTPGEVAVIPGTSGSTGVNFGINQPPTANNVSATYLNPGLTNKVIVPTLNGSDPEQGNLTGVGNTNTVSIKTLPEAGIVYYNNIPVIAGDTIANYNPNLLTFDPPSGAGTYTFEYVELDAALVESNIATATLSFTGLSISGTVYNDMNGLLGAPANTVDGVGSNAGGLNAVLINSVTGKVAATTIVRSDGGYSFPNVDIGNYHVMVTVDEALVGSNPPAIVLPEGWVSVGENLGAGAGSDGKVDGILSLGSVTVNTVNANFGIEQKPEVNNVTWVVDGVKLNVHYELGTSLVNAFDDNRHLNGRDKEVLNEDGSLKLITSDYSFKVNTLPDANYVKLYYDADGEGGAAPIELVAGQIIPSFDPAKLSIVFLRTDSPPELSFTYDLSDEAGVYSENPATYTIQVNSILPVTGLVLVGKNTLDGTRLSWYTLTEQQSASFEIERSTDGVHFKTIAKVLAVGNSAVREDYSYMDNYIGSINVWYRVKIIDVDGRFSTSNIIKVNKQVAVLINVYPNPAQKELTITGITDKSEVRITDLTGKIVSVNIIGGNGISRINTSNLVSGTYLLQVLREGKLLTTKKITKQ